MTLAAGTSLGPYQILGCIGAGGMGEVYRALDPRLGREVAVKVLPRAAAGDAEQMRRLELEARAAGALNHPGVLAVFDIGRDAGTSYVVSELLEGETLRQRLAGGALPLRKALELAVAIAHGLAAAHDKGIVHRDLKPENLFITRDGRPKILDFGLARVRPLAGSPQDATGSLVAGTEPGTIMGTVGYMSPEQVRGQEADQRSDIFSLGAVLYEMLAGRRAYHADTTAETMTAILKQDPAELPASVPGALDRVVRRCLEKRPEERFQSARDLAFALEAMSGVGTASAPRVEAPRPRGARWLVPLLAALVLAGSHAGLFVWGRRTATTAAPRFRQLTFRRGPIDSARFAPDGQTVVFSANWEGRGFDLMTARVGSPEWRSLGLPAGNVAAISSGAEIALLIGTERRARLARVPLAGGAPREVAEDVTDADWAPDGEHLAICRARGGLDILEYPIGHKLPRAMCASPASPPRETASRLWPVGGRAPSRCSSSTRRGAA
jgi:eukaryotic-like serine/threonine-protein kinase